MRVYDIEHFLTFSPVFIRVIFIVITIFNLEPCDQVANYCSTRLHTALQEELEPLMENWSGDRIENSCQEMWKKAFVNCFLKVDDEIGGKQASLEPVAPETVGSTAVVAVICSSHIIVSNCGDSRAVLCRGKEAMALSVDHKVR